MSKRSVRAWLWLAYLAVAMGLSLFLPAGTVRYWQAWAHLAVFFGASLPITLYLTRKDPALLARRLSGGPTGEKAESQKLIMLFVSIGFIGLLVVPALDHRFTWSSVPLAVVVACDVLSVIGFYAVFRVYKENTFACSVSTFSFFRCEAPPHVKLRENRGRARSRGDLHGAVRDRTPPRVRRQSALSRRHAPGRSARTGGCSWLRL
jgi:hypothetical protein